MGGDHVEALVTLGTLIREGHAGLDQYDDTRFVVTARFAEAEQAIDDLGGRMLATAPPGARPSHIAAILSRAVRVELGLDRADAPLVELPLASRAVGA